MLPRGKLLIDHWMDPVPAHVRVSKMHEERGLMAIVYRLLSAPTIRRSAPGAFAALEAEANRPN